MLLPTNEPTERLEFRDDHGAPAPKLSLPRNPPSFGLEKGTVYLQRSIPVAVPPSGSARRTA